MLIRNNVSINGFDSELRALWNTSGSSLGPLLFLIYINDFRLCFNNDQSGHFADDIYIMFGCLNNAQSCHFANDTYIMFGNDKLTTIETVENWELKLVSKWLRLNKLSLNALKTRLIFFHSNNIF